MTLGIGFGAERLALLALRWSKTSALAVLTLLAVIGVSLTELRFDEEINRVFLSDSALSQMQREYQTTQTPPYRSIIIYIKAPAPFTAAEMTVLREISFDLEFVKGVAGVRSPFMLRMSPKDGAPDGEAVFPADIPETYEALLAGFRALETGLPTYISPDRAELLMTVNVDIESTDVSSALLAIQVELSRALPETIEATLTGEDAISLEIVRSLKDDLIQLNLWGGLLVTLATLALLRDFRVVILTIVPAICGAAGVLALSVWLDYPITVLSNVVPILLLVLGVANGVHLARHLINTGADVAGTLREIGPPCALTAITTALAFASIMITSNDQVYEFAVLGALGTAFSFAIATVIFALLALTIGPVNGAQVSSGTRLAQRLTICGQTYPKIVVTAGFLALGLTSLGFFHTKPWFALHHNMPDNSATKVANDAISDTFGGVFQMIVDVDGDWEKTKRLTDSLAVVAGSEAVVSEASLARWLNNPEDRPSADQILTFPKALVDTLRPNDETQRIFVSTPEPMRSNATLRRFDELFKVAESGGADRIFGLPVVMRQEATTLISQLSQSLIIASLGATFIVALAFRTLRLVPILLVVNILPLMVTGAALHWFAEGKLTPTAVLALTIAFGIAIDDSVHFLSRFQQASRTGKNVHDALVSAALSAGQAMVLTTALLSAGLCITLLSDFGPIRLFGAMIITILWVALLTDLLLLPALLKFKDRWD